MRELNASGSTVRELLEDLASRIPALGSRVYGNGEIQPFVNVYVDGEDVRTQDGLDTPVAPGATLILLPAMAGGASVLPQASVRPAPARRRLPTTKPARSLLDLVGKTPLVELSRLAPPGTRIYAKLEGQNPTGSIKDRIAKAMIEAAEASGDLEPGMELLEPTSGNTGISLALIAKLKGYSLTCVMPENATAERKRLLELYGARIISTPGEQGSNGAVRVAQELAAADPRYFMPFQYGNEANPRAHYEGTGAEIAAAEPIPGDPVMGLRSLEDGYVPPILDVSKLDRKVLVSNAEAIAGLRDLLTREGIFSGVSSGAVGHVARKLAAELDDGVVVAILADGGWKYLSADFWDADDVERSMEQTVWW